ncbi:MAG: hypothetical protein HDR20_03345 [Lachnospiraceae bacterium]|nr:hypothetical protein [Lachnospiraceae bacterium]
MKKECNISRDNTGATTIVVICVMAVIMALSLGLFLTASVLLSTSGRTLASEQSRILAVSFSEEIEEMLTSDRYAFGSLSAEEAGRAENTTGSSIWYYIKQSITDGSWPYYDEDDTVVHSRENAVRTFQISRDGTVGEVVDIRLSMYWTREGNGNRPGRLVVETTAVNKEQSCSITDVYELDLTMLGDYERWSWKHVEKK